MFVAREAQARDGPELGEVLAHLVLVEAVGDATNRGLVAGKDEEGMEEENETAYPT